MGLYHNLPVKKPMVRLIEIGREKAKAKSFPKHII